MLTKDELINGDRLNMEGAYEPSSRTIKQRTAAIRATWDQRDWNRALGIIEEEIEPMTVPIVSSPVLDRSYLED